MIYEIRSYQVDAPDVPEFERLFGDGYVSRKEFSPLTGFWRTTDQSVSELVHVWPYKDLSHRAQQRAAAATHPNWPPPTSPFINRMVAEVVLPFDFVEDREPGTTVGPVFEIRYDYFTGADLKAAVPAWTNAIQERSKHYALVLAGRLEFGQTNGIVQIWGYPDDSHSETWPPAIGPEPTSTVAKLLAPSAFSPLH